MATPSFSVTTGATFLTIDVENASGYYIQFYGRTYNKIDGNYKDIVSSDWIKGSASGNSQYVSGLDEETKYVINVRYNTSASSVGSTWIGGQTVKTAGTYNVSFTTKGVSCNLYWYTGSNAYKTTSLSSESEGFAFTARTMDGDDYVSGAKNITCLDGYTTPITWQYNSNSSGTMKTTTIANGGKNSIDITSYNRTIYVYATKKPTTSTLTVSMGTGVASWVVKDSSGTAVKSGTSSKTVEGLTIGSSYTVTFTAATSYTFGGLSTKDVPVTILASGSSVSSGKAALIAYLSVNIGTGVASYFANGVQATYDQKIKTYIGDTVDISNITVTDSNYYEPVSSKSVYITSVNQSITLTATVKTYTFYYEVDRYIDGTYSLSDTGNTTGDYNGAYVSLSTAQGKVNPGDNYNYSTCTAGNYATWQSSYSRFYITSKSSSNRSILKLYYVSKSFSVSASRAGYEKAISSVSVSASTASYGSSVTFSAALYDGARFTGWYDASGTLQSTSRTYSKTITANTTLYARAVLDSFAWTYAKSTGSYKISLEEWTRLQTFINRKRTSAYSFTATGDYLTAAMYNQIVAAIGTGTSVKRGQGISAALLNALVTNANNM